MKQVVDGLVYDTSTSEAIHSSTYYAGHDIPANGRETLYKTTNHRFFLLDQPSMLCIRPIRIIPKTPGQVTKWLERVGAPETVFVRAGVNLRLG